MSSFPERNLRPAWAWLAFLLLLAIFQDFLANGRPLYCRIDDSAYFPGLRSIWSGEDRPFGHPVLDSMRLDPVRWKTYPYQNAWFAPIPFSPGEWLPRPACNLAPPGTKHPELPPRFRHWLGTDSQGRDVAAGMVAGARIALLTGGLAMSMAFLLGLLLGGIAGYFGDDRLRVRVSTLAAALLGLTLALVWAWTLQEGGFPGWQVLIFPTLLLLALTAIGSVLGILPVLSGRILFPADLLIMRMVEIFNAVPRLILIVALAALVARQSTWIMILLIGLFGWTTVAQFIRAELLRIRSLNYIAAARGLGFPEWRILLRHALPNALQPALIVFAFGTGSAILLEASLSFLGFGGQEFQGISWGSLLQNVVRNRQAWWLAIPPGLAIGLTVLALNTIGEAWSRRR